MFTITTNKSQTETIKKKIEKLKTAIPRATAKALTVTARAVEVKEIDEMKRVFKNPVPFMLKAFHVTPAKPEDLKAVIKIKDEQHGSPLRSYATILRPQIYGGERDVKSFERRLRAIRVLPANLYIVPGSGCDLDSYGNMSRGQIIKILSYFRAFKEAGYSANRPVGMKGKGWANIEVNKKLRMMKARKRKGVAVEGYYYFALTKWKNGLHPGIYKRTTGGKIIPVWMFVRAPLYKPLFQFHTVADKAAKEQLPIEIKKAMDAEMGKL
ncbi:MAG: hypothetical protein V1933_01675 [Candidatus Omnitrophota bacterium]